MTVVLHPPSDVSFSGDPLPVEDQARIARVLRAAVQRAMENAVRDGVTHSAADRTGAGDVSQPFDPTRADPSRGTYLVPSYQDAGKLTGVKLLELIPEAAPGFDVTDGPSPLEGGLIMSLPGVHYVHIRSPRYVTAGTLTQAYLMGLAVFGTTSFAILQGPWGSPKTRYWAVGTDPAVTVADLGEKQLPEHTEEGKEVLPAELAGKVQMYTGEHMESTISGTDGKYLTRGFITKDRAGRWNSAQMAEVWFAQLQAEQQKGVTAPPTIQFRRRIFADIDRLVAEVEGGDDTNLQRAAELLSRADRVAFGLVDWETKVSYLKILLAAWTWQEEKTAIVQIFASLRNGKEVDAVVALLRQAGRYDQLFDDLGSEVYNLLATVGESFPRDHGPLTVGGFVQLLQSMHLMPKTLREALLGTVLVGSDDTNVPEAVLDQAHDAVMGFIEFGAGLGESLVMLVTEPGTVIEGLARLLIKATLVSLHYEPAVVELTQLLAALAEKVLAGMRGADRLGCGEKIVSKVKWRLVWEIASLFVGPGEVKAVVQGAGIAEKLPGILRFLGILARAGEAAEAGTEGVRLARLAAMLKAERAAFASVEEAAELLSRLPDADVTRLGKLLSSAEIREGETLAELAARSQALGLQTALEDAIAKAELLKAMAAKAGGLTDEITEAFHVLVGPDGLGLADAERVVAAIGEGEGARFAAALRRIPVGRLAADARAAFLEVVAASPSRMEAVAELGADTFAAVYRRVAGRGEAIDEYLAALQEVGDRLAGQGDAAEFRRLLDRLEADDPASWLEIENTRRVRGGQRAISDWAQQLRGSPRAQHALDRLLRRNEEGMVDSLIDHLAGDKGLISDHEVVQALEEIAGMSDGELDGMAELKRYMDRAGPRGDFPEWHEILFTEPERRHNMLELIAGLRDPANPADLVVRSGMEDVVNAALREGANIQSGLGHLETARSLLRDFPGARFRFEDIQLAGGVRRDVDIVVEMDLAGRQVDVEVKSYQASTGLGDVKVRRQISKDLLRHLADPGGPWSDLLWRFPDPAYASNFPAVERIFGEELAKLAAEGKLTMPLQDARAALGSRFAAAPPWGLIDVLH